LVDDALAGSSKAIDPKYGPFQPVSSSGLDPVSEAAPQLQFITGKKRFNHSPIAFIAICI
jgi:hypothetical protein